MNREVKVHPLHVCSGSEPVSLNRGTTCNHTHNNATNTSCSYSRTTTEVVGGTSEGDERQNLPPFFFLRVAERTEKHV